MAAIWFDKGNYFQTGKNEARYTCLCEGKEAQPHRCACKGTFPQAPLQRHLKCTSRGICQDISRHVPPQTNPHRLPAEACLHRFICRGILNAPELACPHGCTHRCRSTQVHVQRHFCTDASTVAWPDMHIHKHIHSSVPAEVWQHRCTWTNMSTPQATPAWRKRDKQSMHKWEKKYVIGLYRLRWPIRTWNARKCHIQKHIRKSNTGFLYGSKCRGKPLLNTWFITCNIHKLQQANFASLFLKKMSCGLAGTASVISYNGWWFRFLAIIFTDTWTNDFEQKFKGICLDQHICLQWP